MSFLCFNDQSKTKEENDNMAKMTEIKLKYPMERTRALCSVLAKKDSTLEVELNELLEQLYKKNVKPEVRKFIEELELDEETKRRTQRNQ